MTKKQFIINKATGTSETCGKKLLSISVDKKEKLESFEQNPSSESDKPTFESKRAKRRKDFKAQLITQERSSLSNLEQRLSSNLSILVPLLKRSCPNNLLQIENLNSAGKINNFDNKGKFTPQLGNSLPPPRHPNFSELHSRQRRKKKKFENTLILPIASASQLLPRPISRQVKNPSLSADIGETPSGRKLSPHQQNSTENDFIEGETANPIVEYKDSKSKQ
uniref:Uncharacterized protein n=1 Tax=Ciona savignyi TaxID=51511 RepID=H2ZD60_CIOSA